MDGNHSRDVDVDIEADRELQPYSSGRGSADGDRRCNEGDEGSTEGRGEHRSEGGEGG